MGQPLHSHSWALLQQGMYMGSVTVVCSGAPYEAGVPNVCTCCKVLCCVLVLVPAGGVPGDGPGQHQRGCQALLNRHR